GDGEIRVPRQPVEPLREPQEERIGARAADLELGGAVVRQRQHLRDPPARDTPPRCAELQPDRSRHGGLRLLDGILEVVGRHGLRYHLCEPETNTTGVLARAWARLSSCARAASGDWPPTSTPPIRRPPANLPDEPAKASPVASAAIERSDSTRIDHRRTSR